MNTRAKRGRPAKQEELPVEQPAREIAVASPALPEVREPDAPDTEPAPTHPSRYTVTKPGEQWVVKVGDSVVYASRNEDDVKRYIELTER